MADLIDAASAVAFAARFGPPNIMAFENGCCLHAELPTREVAAAWVEANAERDIYFAPAALRDAFVGKPRKSDCLGSHYAWVDVDPPKGLALDPKSLAAWQAAMLAEIEATDLPRAQIVVSSGRGLWLYWRLPHQLPPDDVEAINYALRNRFGGGDACHNIDRIARLPYRHCINCTHHNPLCGVYASAPRPSRGLNRLRRRLFKTETPRRRC